MTAESGFGIYIHRMLDSSMEKQKVCRSTVGKVGTLDLGPNWKAHAAKRRAGRPSSGPCLPAERFAHLYSHHFQTALVRSSGTAHLTRTFATGGKPMQNVDPVELAVAITGTHSEADTSCSRLRNRRGGNAEAYPSEDSLRNVVAPRDPGHNVCISPLHADEWPAGNPDEVRSAVASSSAPPRLLVP